MNENENNNINETNYNSDLYEINKWDDLNIDINILRGIYAYGLEMPSPIQCKAIMPMLSGKDLIAQAQSGTGKTAAFTIGTLSLTNVNINKTQSIILSPTRELSIQTAQVITSIGGMMNNLRVQCCIGGGRVDITSHKLPHIIVGCPGKVYDLLLKRIICGNDIQLLVLDEADEMLSDGFRESVYNIFQLLNINIQVALFTATLPNNIYNITTKFMRDPVKICVKSECLTLEGIIQYFVAINNDNEKYLTLKNIYSFISLSQCIIYCNSVNRVIKLYEEMKNDGFPVSFIHSNMDKCKREESFKEFKTGASRVLISTDITARGIDIQQVSVVINFDLPKCVHKYLHRIGRSGRWGRKGVGINLVTRYDVDNLRTIEKHYSCEIQEMPMNYDCV